MKISIANREDCNAMNCKLRKYRFIPSFIRRRFNIQCRYVRLLRLEELCISGPKWYRLGLLIIKPLRYRMKIKTGYEIPAGVCGSGLCLMHLGPIIISDRAKIGKNCRIHSCVNIGSTKGTGMGPQIGDNVYIGPGVQIVGPIKIADGTIIGAGAVVVKDQPIKNATIAGVPAKIIKQPFLNNKKIS